MKMKMKAMSVEGKQFENVTLESSVPRERGGDGGV